jgi:anti-anti-sigma regulatory factor
MLNVTVENIGELAVVECEGRIVQSEAAFKLREAVTSQTDARIVVLELSEVHAIEGGGLGMLLFLQLAIHLCFTVCTATKLRREDPCGATGWSLGEFRLM